MGWASGLQSGLQVGRALREGQMREDLAQEAARYTPTEGAYGQGLNTNLENLQASRESNLAAMQEQGYSPEQIATASKALDQAQAEITRRAGLTSPDYSVGGKTYGSLKEAEQAAAPMRTAGLANVYRAQGDVEKASELEARAQQQQLGGLHLSKAQRENESDVRMGNFNTELNALQNPTTDQIKALAAKHQLDRKQQFEVASQITGIAKSQLEAHDIDIKNAVQGKTFEQLLDLHKNDKRFGDGMHFVSGKGAGGSIILNLVSDADPTKVIRTRSFKDADLATAYLRKEAEDPGNVAEWMLGMNKSEAAIRASNAAAAASGASVGLTGARLKGYEEERAGRSEAAKIAADFDALSLEDQNGPKGAALKTKFNMANAKAGGQIALGVQARPGQTMTDVEKENLRAFRDWEKEPRNAKLDQGEKDRKATEMGVVQFVRPQSKDGSRNLGDNTYGGGATKTTQQKQGLSTQTTPVAPALTSMNTRLLAPAGNEGYNVELPDGTTRTIPVDQLEAMGYKFPSGTGLQRPWYADLMPRR